MTHNKIYSVLLAAGQGKRMGSQLPKVAHLLQGKPLLIWSMTSLINTQISNLMCVISPKHTIVEDMIHEYSKNCPIDLNYCFQENPQGTGHAVQCAVSALKESFKTQIPDNIQILISYGDCPHIKAETYQKMIAEHSEHQNNFTLLAFHAHNPQGYGRILQNDQGQFLGIREEKDCTPEQKKITLCNSGILIGKLSSFEQVLPELSNENAQKEYYLTDVPTIAAHNKKMKVQAIIHDNEEELMGINTQEQLKEMEQLSSTLFN